MFILRKQFLRVILILWVINLEIKLNEYNPWRQKQSYDLLRPIDKSTDGHIDRIVFTSCILKFS